jgi:hypothetical protein
MQFTPDGSEADTAIDLIQQAQPNIVFICLGMPKQEYFAFRYRREQTSLNAPLLLCVGAAMEFALGQKKRAPCGCKNRHGMVLASRQRTAPLVAALHNARLKIYRHPVTRTPRTASAATPVLNKHRKKKDRAS